MKKIKELLVKYKELIVYVIFGGLTTVVNLAVFELSGLALGDERYLISNVIAWFAAVVFAYVTNKLWVFESKSWRAKVLLKEIPTFFAARVFSFLFEEAGLFVLVDLLSFRKFSVTVLSYSFGGEFIAKVILAVAVVIMNYVFSKLIVFRKKTA